ncbi:MAG: glycosyltransferase family 4 protein [Leptolyngbyaceae cyanobacterium bins.302]|nr:glycosyltransferase family 4 protein [Leptolyngbyaceae cyanobacterium bins.302]
MFSGVLERKLVLMRILVVSTFYPPNLSTSTQGVYKRLSMFIEALSKLAQLDVLFYVPSDIDTSEAGTKDHEQALSQYWRTNVNLFLCPTAIHRQALPKWRKKWDNIFSFFHQHNFPIDPQSLQLQAFESCLECQPDAIFVHRLPAFCPALLTQKNLPPIYFDLDDIEHIKYVRRLQQPPIRLQSLFSYLQVPTLLWGERQAIRAAQLTFVCSERDRHYLTQQFNAQGLTTIPNAINIPQPQPITPEPTLLLIGGYYYHANTQAANFLIEQVWSHIYAKMPNARLLIAGTQPENIRSYGKSIPGVEFLGFVKDLDTLYQQSRIVCCPIFTGGGTRVKMIEAAAYGKPIIATQIGAEGLNFRDQKEFLLCNSSQEFTVACLELLQNDSLCAQLGAAAHQMAIQHYDRANVINLICQKIQLATPIFQNATALTNEE